MSDVLAPFEAMLDKLFPPQRVREIDAGADWTAELAEIEASGFLDALADDDLPFAEVVPLWRAIGHRAAPFEIADAMITRSVGGASEPARALALSAAISGAADRVLAMTIDHAEQRSQFGKPIGRQQAIQQQLAVMAEQVVAVRLAVELASAGSWPTMNQAAFAKTVAATYAAPIANTAHAVHGAIGISEEYDLQLYTRRLQAWRLDGGGETLWAQRLGRSVLTAQDDTLDWIRSTLF